MNPYCDPILALAVLFFCGGNELTGKLFAGDSQEKRFSDILHRVLNQLTHAQQTSLACWEAILLIGTHSVRKGAASWAMSLLGGTNPITVSLRVRLFCLAEFHVSHNFPDGSQSRECERQACICFLRFLIISQIYLQGRGK